MKKKRNKAYRERPVNPRAIDWALAGSYTLPAEKQAELLGFVDHGFDRLRAGAATRDDWNTVANGMNIAEALTYFQIATNFKDEIQKAMAALRTIATRMLKTGSSTCYAAELADIKEARDIYKIQLSLCSQAECSRAVRRVNDLHRCGAMQDVARLYEEMAA